MEYASRFRKGQLQANYVTIFSLYLIIDFQSNKYKAKTKKTCLGIKEISYSLGVQRKTYVLKLWVNNTTICPFEK